MLEQKLAQEFMLAQQKLDEARDVLEPHFLHALEVIRDRESRTNTDVLSNREPT